MGTKPPMIINEVLALLQHIHHYVDEDDILETIKSFKKQEINDARWLLYETLDKVEQIPSRRRDSTLNLIQDITTLMKETDPKDMPDFVVKDVFKLLPITFDHFDLTKVLNEMESMKNNLAELQSKMKESNNIICDLRAEVVQLRSAVSVSKSPDTSNVNEERKAESAATSTESAVASVSPVEPESAASHTAAASTTTAVQEQARASTSTSIRAYADVAAAVESVSSQKKKVVQAKRDQANQTSSKKDTNNTLTANVANAEVAPASQSVSTPKKKVVPPKQDQVSQMSSKKDTCDDDGFIKVEKKKKKKPVYRNQCGTLPTEPDMVLRPATPTTQLYVSRLHHSTKVEDLVEYIKWQTHWTLRVERLESRYKMNYKSFVVRVPSDSLDTFLKEEFWPKGVVYRRFRGRLRDTSQRETTPLLRVH
ncbi:uncharacterized protein LOC118263167 [Spodoptera frugiperda]|uniref:Uncharacterized protein LOC118263167 n=1 Tax=Spodoptera frugiperda TaxID=7108 RepID=A0A9R0EFN4_SPOFR|nr:uncharacterized protein LOC118263167 [Spodoptera frugiperda]